MVSPEYHADTGPLAAVTLAEGRERQVFIQDFRISKNTDTSILVSPTRSRTDRSSAVPWSGMGLGLLFLNRVYDSAPEPTVRSTESLFWAFPGEGYLLQDHWEKIVWYNLVCRPHRELFTDARGRGDSRVLKLWAACCSPLGVNLRMVSSSTIRSMLVQSTTHWNFSSRRKGNDASMTQSISERL